MARKDSILKATVRKVLLFVLRVTGRLPERAQGRYSAARPAVSNRAHSGRGARRKPPFAGLSRRVLYIGAASLAAVIVAVVLAVTLTGKGKETMVAAADAIAPPETDAPQSATLVMPVYAPLSISKGVSASVVKEVQSRLMDLGYMDEDEPDGIFGESTEQAVVHFQKQHGLETSGTVDTQTYSLMISPEAQQYTITLGAEDTDVEELQQRLCDLGYMEDATGYFGTDTEDAVKKFQKMNSLSQDGKVGKDTREKLYSDDAASNAYSYGEESPKILDYQKRLAKLGYLTSQPDGIFGKATKDAVKRFQQDNGLFPDGYIGPKTEAALMDSGAQSSYLSLGDKGENVNVIQQYLVNLKYMKKVTGYFGTTTDTAVRSFQHNNGLKADGKVGNATIKKLESPNAKQFTGAYITGTNADSLIEMAKTKLGCKYVRGGKGPDKFDCSGFVYWCINKIGVKQGYMTSAAWAKCTKYTKITSMSSLKKGDIIVYDGHVTICEGGGWQIEASSSNGQVVERKYAGSSYWKSVFICGFRIFE